MENGLEELSRRVICCTNWRWMPGMKDMEGWRLYREVVGFTAQDKDGKTVTGWDAIGGEWEYHQVAHFPKLPDLSDPATLGCLVDLLQKAYGNKVVVSIGNDWWSVETDSRYWDQDNTDSFLCAIVFALEAGT